VIKSNLLLVVVYVEAIALMLLVLAICLRMLWRRRRDVLHGERFGRASVVFTAYLSGRAMSPEDAAWLARLPIRARLKLLVSASSALSGEKRTRLTDLAQELGLIDWAEKRCRSRLWVRRLNGVRALTALGSGVSVVPSLLRDRRPEVRAEAIQWASDSRDPDFGSRLIELLGDEMRFPRFTVQNALLWIGAPAVKPLAEYLRSDRGAGLEPALEVAAAMPDPEFLDPARELSRHPSAVVRTHCAHILGALGGNESVTRLGEMLDDDSEEVRTAAAEGLGKLQHWPAGSQLALALRDPAWTVRRAAGLALRALGSPGLVLLRRSTSDRDQFAADMAHQILDLPDTVKTAGW
jgi:HEAT repeats